MASLSEIWGECVTLNNDGVTLMKELEFRAAYASLTRSLSVAKSIVRYQSDRNHNNATTSSDDGKDLRSPFLDTTPLEPDVGADLRGVYRDAYILSGEGLTDESPRQSEEKRMLVVCAVIIFNLALAHHLEALCNDEHAHLHQALALYELAHAIQRDECMRRNGCGNALHEEFYMALCANLGHIHTIKGHSDQASLCFHICCPCWSFFSLPKMVSEISIRSNHLHEWPSPGVSMHKSSKRALWLLPHENYVLL